MKKEDFSKACALQDKIDKTGVSLAWVLRMIDNDDPLEYALVATDRKDYTKTARITDIVTKEWLQNIADTLKKQLEMLEWEFESL